MAGATTAAAGSADVSSSWVISIAVAVNRLIGASGQSTANLRYTPTGSLYETSGGAKPTTRFLYDGDALVAEYDTLGNLKQRYVHGQNADEPLIWFEGGNPRYLHANQQGSIVAVSDGLGNRVNSYDEYGVAATSNVGRFSYTGQIIIPELDMLHYKARIYAPRLGRFMQTDPVGYEDQINLYAYVGNDPINMFDSGGNRRCSNNGCAPDRLPSWIIPRSAWHARSPDFSKMTFNTKPYDTITLHHTGSYESVKSVEALNRGDNNSILRYIGERFGLAQNYDLSDIGYNFVIDKKGGIYEGRSLDYAGAHVEGHNQGNIGIAVLGDYYNSSMNIEQISSMVRLTDFLSKELNPKFGVLYHGDFDPRKISEMRCAFDC